MLKSNRLKPDPEIEARQRASIISIAKGGLPLNAIDRLQEQAARQGTSRRLFSSDLSASEFLLTRECGFEPLGQVMGSAVFSLGTQYMPGASGEIKVHTDARTQARSRALDRLSMEAKMLGADGVVGVRIERKEIDSETRMTEFWAIGTAVRKVNASIRAAEPFLSGLSGQDHWKLTTAGFKPVGFACGICSYFQAPDWRQGSAPIPVENKEYGYLTQGIFECRSIANDRLVADCRRLGAVGIVGTTVETRCRDISVPGGGWGLIIHFAMFGTAIARSDGGSTVAVMPTISLRD